MLARMMSFAFSRRLPLSITASVLTCVTTYAAAAPPAAPTPSGLPPIRDGLERATPLRTDVPPPPPRLPPGDDAIVVPELPPEPKPAEPSEPEKPEDRSRDAIVVNGRWLSVPAPAVDLFYDHHQPLSQPSFGLAFETGASDAQMWAVEVAWMPLMPEPGNWLARGADPTTASYVESNVHMLALDLTFRRQFEIGGIFRVFLGAGLGVAILVGDATTDDVLPDCDEPVEQCGHWPTASRQDVDLPTRILPVLHLTTGLEIDLHERVSLRISGGLKNVTYVGASLGFNL
jgi:hypothetical protein